jgi:hypothetical protein
VKVKQSLLSNKCWIEYKLDFKSLIVSTYTPFINVLIMYLLEVRTLLDENILSLLI